MYPAPFDSGWRHDHSFALLRTKGYDVTRYRHFSIPPENAYAYEEGKCNSEKHSGSSHFPRRALAMGFKQLSCEPANVDAWVFPTPSPGYDFANIFNLLLYLKAIDSLPIKSEYDSFIQSGYIRFVPHQEAHAGISVYTSSFERGCFFTLDGGGDAGDPRDSVFGTFGENGPGLNLKWESIESPDSVTVFHNRLTEYFGFNQHDNGKLSGLAAYGHIDSKIVGYLEESLRWEDGRPLLSVPRIHKTRTNFSSASLDKFDFDKLVNPNPGHLKMISDLKHFSPLDVAASGEHVFRKLVLKTALSLVERHGVTKNICFSGGAFNNVRLNQELSTATGLRSHFSMAPGDSGLALGAALVSLAKYTDTRVKSALLGPSYSRSHTEHLLREFSLPHRPVNVDEVAQLIANGFIVGWFSGRAEYGPRSLGGRSILGDPRSKFIKARLNQLAKRRDFFMPFAPAVLSEHVHAITPEDVASPYMQVAVTLTSVGENLIPAASHVDGSCRMQVVTRDDNPVFHRLISSFFNLTGVPALLNTSFNRHGISTISTPRSAIEHLLQGCIEHLYIDGLLVSRTDFDPDIAPLEEVLGEDELLNQFSDSLVERHRAREATRLWSS
jgi:carbamoyltransferase